MNVFIRESFVEDIDAVGWVLRDPASAYYLCFLFVLLFKNISLDDSWGHIVNNQWSQLPKYTLAWQLPVLLSVHIVAVARAKVTLFMASCQALVLLSLTITQAIVPLVLAVYQAIYWPRIWPAQCYRAIFIGTASVFWSAYCYCSWLGVILMNMGSCPKWMIWISPGAPFWVDSGSVPFLIRQENVKYWQNPGGLKMWPLCFGQFNLHPDPFSRRSWIWTQKCLFWPVAPAIFWGDSECGQGNLKFPL